MLGHRATSYHLLRGPRRFACPGTLEMDALTLARHGFFRHALRILTPIGSVFVNRSAAISICSASDLYNPMAMSPRLLPDVPGTRIESHQLLHAPLRPLAK